MSPNISEVSRRSFLSQAGAFSALWAMGSALPVRAFAERMDDPRIAATPVVDAGFASVRQIGKGIFATISDPSKGLTTMCNGGFVCGKDAALLIEGFVTPNGAAFQMDALRKVSQAPAAGAIDTHYHFDHSMGNSFYGDHGIQLWGHINVPRRIYESYVPLQTVDRDVLLAPAKQQVANATTDVARKHREGDLQAFSNVVDIAKKSVLTLPNRLLDPKKLPLNVDLGNCPIVVESYPGHSGTDLIIRVPDQKVVFSGDLIFNNNFPACFDEQATISGWRDTLKKFSAFDKDTLFVPGHGPVCGQEGVARLSSVFDDIAAQAEKMHKAGIPASEAADRYVIPDQFKDFSLFSWGFCIGPAITKLYSEWGAK